MQSNRWMGAAACTIAALGSALGACGVDRPCDAAERPAVAVLLEGATADETTIEYSVEGGDWIPCPTTSDTTYCGHNVFGTVTVRATSTSGATDSASVESRRVDHCGGTSAADAPRVTLTLR